MTDKLKFLVPALIAGFIIVGCGQKAEEAMPAAEEAMSDAAEAVADTAGDAAEAVEEAASDMADAVSDEPGGYVPTADELIPGETRP